MDVISVKYNGDVVKRSLLSHKLDFGQEWFGMPISILNIECKWKERN